MFQQPYFTPNYGGYQQAQPQNNPLFQTGKNYVQGEVGAQAFQVLPGNSVILWDSVKNIFYEKSVDNSGRPTITAYEFKLVENSNEPSYIDKTLKALETRVNNLEEQYGGIKNESNGNSSNA